MDQFEHFSDSVSDPARRSAALVPSDDHSLERIPKALFIGTGGDILLQCIDDDAPVLFRNIPSGAILPVRAKKIHASGTSASNLVGLF